MKTLLWIVIIIVLIALVARKKDRKGGGDNLTKEPLPKTPVRTVNVKPMPNATAQEAFLANVGNLTNLLDGLITSPRERKLWDEWADHIVAIENDELTALWQKVVVQPQAWIRIMGSWGVSCDNCMEFTGNDGRQQLYTTTDGKPIVNGQRYKVESYCWILTKADGQKSVIKKGTVSPIASAS